jgi:hypothetical protein
MLLRASERTSKKVIFDESNAELVTFGLPTGEERKALVAPRTTVTLLQTAAFISTHPFEMAIDRIRR